jgi:phosphoribosyl 1,2-cyclic phosphodiesterase
LVEFGRAGLFGPARLLVDAGLSARELTRRLGEVGVEPATVDGLLLSHEHDDHARGAERFSRKHGVPLVCSRKTLEAMDRSADHFAGWCELRCGGTQSVAGVEIEPFAVPHDAADPMGFVLSAEGRRFGVATDLGHATALVVERLRGCEVLMVESNHDDRMLAEGPYPWHLKQRVSGRLGHLSNREAAGLLRQVAGPDCRFVVLAHLSEKNNTHELARQSAAAAVRGNNGTPQLLVAVADGPSEAVEL